MKVAFHVDQLWFKRARRHRHVRARDARCASRPPTHHWSSCGSARDGAAAHGGAAHARRPVPRRRGAALDPDAVSVVGHRRQARAPRFVGRCRDRPRDEPRRGASGPRRSTARGDRPRPRVRTVPRAVPAPLALALRGWAASGGETGRRDPGPVAEHRQRSDRLDVDPGVAGACDAAGIVVRRPA